MAKDPIVLAMAKPVPEIMPGSAKAAGAAVVGTGEATSRTRSITFSHSREFSVERLMFVQSDINEEMKIAAAKALASLVSDEGAFRRLYHSGSLSIPVSARPLRQLLLRRLVIPGVARI